MIRLIVNGQPREVAADPDVPLLYVLRNDLNLTGTKFGCGLGQCGACTVIVAGRAVRSCVLPLKEATGKEILTIEGLGSPETPDPLQAAIIDEQASQCGYCTPGVVMAAKAFLDTHPRPTEAQVRDALDEVLCRCGTHGRVIKAIMRVAGTGGR
ncbi:MAG TPA: (2Fe-2S)-binding protein [Candidatus Baltobacteraceae bacterium]|nr:(2Fe-2S)-binding protein [Candidatus Baltobacteraceae bacterium]